MGTCRRGVGAILVVAALLLAVTALLLAIALLHALLLACSLRSERYAPAATNGSAPSPLWSHGFDALIAFTQGLCAEEIAALEAVGYRVVVISDAEARRVAMRSWSLRGALRSACPPARTVRC